MNERELLVDCLERLNRLGLPYMLTGSMASNFWGIPRTTHDLDFVLVLDREDVSEVVAAFADGFALDAEAVNRALSPPHMFNAIDQRSALKVDFWILHEDPFERRMFERRCEVTLFGQRAWIATAEDTLLHKLVWDRITPSERQIGDAAGIVAIQATTLDRDYLVGWGQRLGVEKLLDDLLEGRIRPKST